MKFQIYLKEEEDNVQKCAHCKKAAPAKGKTICGKCSADLKSFRNKANKKEDDGNEGFNFKSFKKRIIHDYNENN